MENSFKNSDPVKHRIAITKNFDNFDFLKTDTTFLFKWFLFLTIHPKLFPKNVKPFRPFHNLFSYPRVSVPWPFRKVVSFRDLEPMLLWKLVVLAFGHFHAPWRRKREGRLKQGGCKKQGGFAGELDRGRLGGGVWYSLFSALPRKFSIFTEIFRMGWNHQPVIIYEEKWELGCTNLRSSCKKKKHLVEESRRHSDHNFSPKG